MLMKMRRRDVCFMSGYMAFAGASCVRQSRSQAPIAPPTQLVKSGSGLVHEVVRQGTGASAKPGQTVLIHEILTVDGKQIFSSRDKNKPVKFLLGGNQVIPGVDETVTGMRVGELRKATVPPALDGRTFDPKFIRPDADRHYEIELMEIVD